MTNWGHGQRGCFGRSAGTNVILLAEFDVDTWCIREFGTRKMPCWERYPRRCGGIGCLHLDGRRMQTSGQVICNGGQIGRAARVQYG